MSNIQQNLAKILSSRYGRDVRQSIHDGIHNCYEDGKAGSIDLVARELIQQKMSGSPAGTYADLAALISDDPDHSKIYITLEDGNWCYWGGSAWTAGGVYQGVGLADHTVEPRHLDFVVLPVNLFDPSQVVVGKTYSGAYLAEILLRDGYPEYSCIKVSIEPNTAYTVTGLSSNWYLSDADGIRQSGMTGTITEDQAGITINTNAAARYMYLNFKYAVYPIESYMVVKGASLPAEYSNNKVKFTEIVDTTPKVGSVGLEQVGFWERNLFDPSDAVLGKIYRLEADTVALIEGYPDFACARVAVVPGKKYTVSGTSYNWYTAESDGGYVSYGGDHTNDLARLTITVPSGAEYLHLTWRTATFPITSYMVVEGDALPSAYVPYNKLGLPDIISIPSPASAAICHVAPTGDDDNLGTQGSPFASFQRAIDAGAEIIIAAPGDYVGQTISASGMQRLEIRVAAGSATQHHKMKTARLMNGVDVAVALDGSLLKGALSVDTDSHWHKVFISKEMPLVYEDSRPALVTHNVILWETGPAQRVNIDDVAADRRLVPVLTLAECQGTSGSFFYDGTHVYIHPSAPGMTYKRLADEASHLAQFSQIGSLKISGIDFMHGAQNSLYITYVDNFDLQDSESSYSAYGRGMQALYASGRVMMCRGVKNRIDGAGLAGTGDTHFIDCEYSYNYDDGISHHDACTGSIRGGEYSNNFKGGISPAHGCKVDLYSTISHHNGYGYYCYADGAGILLGRAVRHVGCVAYANNTGIRVHGYHVQTYGCDYTDNSNATDVTSDGDSSLTQR